MLNLFVVNIPQAERSCLPLAQVKALLRGSPLLAKYEQSLIESYVEDNKRVKW